MEIIIDRQKVIKAISTIEELDLEGFKNLNIGVEIQDFTEPNLSYGEIVDIVARYEEKFKDFPNIKSMHGPFLDLKPSSPDKEIRKVSYDKYLGAMKIAKELDMDYIIFHSQINPYLNQPWIRKINNLQSKEFWTDLLEEVPDYKGVILLENIFEERPEMLKELIEVIELPNIKINLDIGHAKLGKVSLEEWIKELKDYIAYIHVHSNNGIYDEHEGPNSEEINNLYYLLDKYRVDPVLCLEYQVDDLQKEIIKYKY